jgi:hypothetical protein
VATIDASYFFGELNVAQKSDSSVSASLTAFIDEMEPMLLTDFFGYDLYKAYVAGIAGSTQIYKDIRDGKEYTNRQGISTKWRGLIFTTGSAKKSLIANYVYWHWMRNEASVTTGTGEKVPDAQNASNATPVSKMVRAWNQMVDWLWELSEFLLSNADTYPLFQNQFSRIPWSILKKQNVFGI